MPALGSVDAVLCFLCFLMRKLGKRMVFDGSRGSYERVGKRRCMVLSKLSSQSVYSATAEELLKFNGKQLPWFGM